jgi:hypothetical protein
MIDSLGLKGADDYLQMTADFGTLLHSALVGIKEKGSVIWSEQRDLAYEYFILAYKKKGIEPDYKTIRKMTFEYCKHVSSLLQWVYDRVEAIYAIEVPAMWEELSICTPIDIYCSCRQTEKGDFRKTTVNMKTSSQVSNHQFEQVACEFNMWNSTYPDEQAEFTAILRTMDWRKTPTYEYKYLGNTDAMILSSNARKRLELCLDSESSYLPNPVNRIFEGETKIGESPVIITKSLQEEWATVNK